MRKKYMPFPKFFTHGKIIRQTEHTVYDSYYRVTSYESPEAYETLHGTFWARVTVSVLPVNPEWQGAGFSQISDSFCLSVDQALRVHDELVADLVERGIGTPLGTYVGGDK